MDKKELSFRLLERQIELHKLADTKAYIILLILGFLCWKMIPLIKDVYFIKSFGPMSGFIKHTLIPLLFIVLTVSFIYTLLSSIKALFPRVNSPSESVIFWGNAAERTPKKIADEILIMRDDEIIFHILSEYQINSFITKRKFSYIKRAFIALSIYILAFLILYTLSQLV